MSRTLVLSLCLLGTTLVPSALLATDYVVDSVHSSLIFKIEHMGVTDFYGRFNDVSGELSFDEEKLAESRVKVVVKASSLDTNSKNRDTHVKSEDFLHAEEHPEIVFEGKGFTKKSEDTYELTGTMKFRGVEKKMKVLVKKSGSADHHILGKRVGFTCTFTVLRSDFGMSFALDTLSDEVGITLGLEFAIAEEKKKEEEGE